MDSSDVSLLVIILVLVIFSALFSAAETALTTVNKIRIRTMADEGHKRAIRVTKIIDQPGRMLGTILIGNNIVNLTASSLATVLGTRLWGNIGAGLATGALTIVILVFSEITPKTVATLYSENLSYFFAPLILTLMRVIRPIVFILNQLSVLFLKLIRSDPKKQMQTITEEELRTILDISSEEGVIEPEEQQMINNVVDFGDAEAKDVMVIRKDMVFVNINATYEELIEIFRDHMYTRYPIFDETRDEVIGIINMKDILLYDQGTPFSIAKFLRDPLFTHECKKVNELLTDMRAGTTNIIIVLDEYGITAGLITIEDLLEEIVGDIRDEFDADEEMRFVTIKDNEYIINGSTPLDELNAKLDLNIQSEDYDSVGGFIIALLDRLPVEQETVQYNNITFKIELLDKNRIDKVRIIIEPIEEDE